MFLAPGRIFGTFLRKTLIVLHQGGGTTGRTRTAHGFSLHIGVVCNLCQQAGSHPSLISARRCSAFLTHPTEAYVNVIAEVEVIGGRRGLITCDLATSSGRYSETSGDEEGRLKISEGSHRPWGARVGGSLWVFSLPGNISLY